MELIKSTSCYEYICFSQDNEHKQLLAIHKYLILSICNGTPKTFLFLWPGLHLQRNCIYCVVYSYSLWHLLLLGFLLGNQHFSHNSLYLENAIVVQKHVIFFFFFVREKQWSHKHMIILKLAWKFVQDGSGGVWPPWA